VINLSELREKALVIVAHPDDETIWMGGTILMNPQVRWTIFSLCRRDDRDRAPKFRKVCKYYGARGIISDLDDEEVLNLRESLPEIRARLLDFFSTFRNRDSIRSGGGLPAASQRGDSALRRPSSPRFRELPQSRKEIQPSVSQFDYIFTHGYNGEYGHPRHRGVSRVVKDLVSSGTIKTKKLFTFSYKFDERKNICRPRASDVFIKLSPTSFSRKKKIITDVYGFKKSTFEYRTLSKVENFKLLKRK